MSAGKKVRGAQTPAAVERKGPMTNPKASKQSAPAMSNKNKGVSPSTDSMSKSEQAGSGKTTYPNFSGEKVDLHIKDEVTSSHIRNGGSALRGGANRNSSHDTGNRYGK